ncbi:MAG: hypothetical protein P4L66_14955 [Acetobacteraceae bacterium]|nr:hypothetical protein [Acetobacteraceae bacterium]
MKLTLLTSRLGSDLEVSLAAALADEAQALAKALRDTFATAPGGPHSHPWQRSGTLHASIEVAISETEAVIGSNDPVALYQEHGGPTLPPRPSFGPLAATAGPGIAHRLGQIAHDAIAPLNGK